MDKQRKILLLILTSVAINRACSLLPLDVYFDPFPLYDLLDQDGSNVGINLQSYVYFITVHISIILVWWAFRITTTNFREIFTKFIILELVSLADFFIIYEHPWFYIGNYGVEFTDPKILLYTYYTLKWSPGK